MELMFTADPDACKLLVYVAHNACFCTASNKPGFGSYSRLLATTVSLGRIVILPTFVETVII